MPVMMAVFVGGGLGAVLRHLLNTFVMQQFQREFPLGIMIINILGSLAMGLLIGLFANVLEAPQHLRSFLMVGVLGGFTTFSSFSADAIALIERGEYTQAAIYIVGSVLISLLALMIGMWLMRNMAAPNV